MKVPGEGGVRKHVDKCPRILRKATPTRWRLERDRRGVQVVVKILTGPRGAAII
jgi:hypothetical protein